MMQGNAMRLTETMVGQSFTEQSNKPISSKGSRVGAVIREFAQFILA